LLLNPKEELKIEGEDGRVAVKVHGRIYASGESGAYESYVR